MLGVLLIAIFALTVWMWKRFDLTYYYTSISAAWRLLAKGCVRFKSLQFRPFLGVKDLTVRSCGPASEVVFQCSRIVITSTLWEALTGRPINVVVEKAEVNCLMDKNGLMHIVKLLQDIGYMQETSAEKRPDFVITGESVEVTQYDIARPTFAGDVRVLTARILIPDGTLLLPEEAAAALGTHAVVYAAIGAHNIKKHAQEVEGGGNASWLSSPPTPPSGSGPLGFPLLAEVKSDGLQASLLGWRTQTGILFQEPVRAKLRLTEDLIECCLAKITPLLQYIADIKDAQDIDATLTPQDMHWPCETVAIRLEPMRLFMHCKAMLRTLLHVVSRDQLELVKSGKLEAWTSAVEAHWWREGFIESHRMDLMIGLDLENARRMHCAVWGRVDTAHGDAIDMTLGLPADTLTVYGIKGLPENFMLDIKLGGTCHRPMVDWARAAKNIGKLFMHGMLGKSPKDFFSGLTHAFGGHKTPQSPTSQQAPAAQNNLHMADADSSDVGWDHHPPPPSLPLPWDAFEEIERADVPLKHMQ